MTIDKFGNLYVVDKSSEEIIHIAKEKIFGGNGLAKANTTTLYSKALSNAVRDPEGLYEVDGYLFWTNMQENNLYGGIHKAFSAPFPNYPYPF